MAFGKREVVSGDCDLQHANLLDHRDNERLARFGRVGTGNSLAELNKIRAILKRRYRWLGPVEDSDATQASRVFVVSGLIMSILKIKSRYSKGKDAASDSNGRAFILNCRRKIFADVQFWARRMSLKVSTLDNTSRIFDEPVLLVKTDDSPSVSQTVCTIAGKILVENHAKQIS